MVLGPQLAYQRKRLDEAPNPLCHGYSDRLKLFAPVPHSRTENPSPAGDPVETRHFLSYDNGASDW